MTPDHCEPGILRDQNTQRRTKCKASGDRAAAGIALLLPATSLENLAQCFYCDPDVLMARVQRREPETQNIRCAEPRSYVGGSAGQSSLIQAIDALLGIDHGDSATGMYLRGVRAYMPVGHRRFVTDVEKSSRVRTRVLQGPAALRVAYNAAVDQVGLFRHRHIELARDYVTKPSGTTTKKGTGGTAFAEFLGAAQRHTIANKISDN